MFQYKITCAIESVTNYLSSYQAININHGTSMAKQYGKSRTYVYLEILVVIKFGNLPKIWQKCIIDRI